jgi:hypothetical protein
MIKILCKGLFLQPESVRLSKKSFGTVEDVWERSLGGYLSSTYPFFIR